MSAFDDPVERLVPVAVLAGAVIMLFFALSRGEPEPTPHDAMDGLYTREGCPDFVIERGRISFEGGRIEGRLDRARSAIVLETSDTALRYAIGPQGCRLETEQGGQILRAERETFASPVIMIMLLRSDLEATAYWTRIGPPPGGAPEASQAGDEPDAGEQE